MAAMIRCAQVSPLLLKLLLLLLLKSVIVWQFAGEQNNGTEGKQQTASHK